MPKPDIVHFSYERATCRLTVWNKKQATLSNLYSVKRGRGHAKSVLQLVIDYADANGLTLLLEVRRFGGDHLCPDNSGLKALYSKFGFVDCGQNMMRRLQKAQKLQAS